MRCTSFCTADHYHMNDLAKHLSEIGLSPKFHDDVIHIQQQKEDRVADVFFFSYGCIVIWNMNPDEEQEMLQIVKTHEVHPLKAEVEDFFTFMMGDTTRINEEVDEIILESDDPLIKLSFSHGLSQSVKLETFEASIKKTIARTRHIPKTLAAQGKISLSRKRLTQLLGALFEERNSINLHTDILDTPEFFWRRPKYEPYYIMAAQYMDIQIRMQILNKRLDVIHELYDVLSNELNHLHSSRLELVIIFLIVIEVVLVLLKDFLKLI